MATPVSADHVLMDCCKQMHNICFGRLASIHSYESRSARLRMALVLPSSLQARNLRSVHAFFASAQCFVMSCEANTTWCFFYIIGSLSYEHGTVSIECGKAAQLARLSSAATAELKLQVLTDVIHSHDSCSARQAAI
eukprot:scaffold195174_cov15-Prasinocladus_malaysianus.AAC.1